MAGKDLSLKIAVKLLTDNFKKGTASMLAGLRSLQYRILAFSSALGVGAIGLQNFVSRMRDVAKETTSAVTALKNVSGSAAAFASNTKWLSALADKYGVAINTLTLGFAKFKAAADIANMAAEDQRKIFESVSRATVAFGLTSEDQRGVFMALQQMMSKGKVIAEELRLQLAERMPVAIQAMAAAVGVSVNELDKMMKQGMVISSEVLPKFAEELERMIPNVDLDNLNKSLTDLGNTFVELTKKLNIEGSYKSIVEFVNRLLQNLLNNTKGWATAIGAAFYLYIANKVRGLGKFFIAETDKATKGLRARQRALDSANKNELAKKQALEAAKERYAQARAEREVLYEQAAVEAKIKLSNRELKEKQALDKAETQYKNAVLAAQQQQAQFDKEKSERDLANASAWVRMTYGMKAAGVQLLGVLKSLGAAIMWNAAIAGAMALLAALGKVLFKAIRIRNAVKKTKEALAEPIGPISEETDIRTNLKILASSKNEKTREGALMRINSLLGTEYKLNSLNAKKQEEINAKAARYIKYLQAQAELEKSKKVLEENQKSYSDYQKEIKESRFNFDLNPSKTATDKLSAINDAKAAVEKWSSVVASLESEFGIEPANFDYKPSGGGLSDEDSPIKKASDRYAESLNDLSAQLALGLMTQKEYERAKRDLIEKTRAEILASGDAGLMGSDFASGIANAFGTFAHGELRDREEAAVDMIDEYNAEIASLVRQANQKIITEEEYQRALGELTKRIYDELGALDLTGLSTSIINQVQAARSTARGINATTRTTPAAVKNAPSAVDLALMTPREQMEVRLNLEQDSLAELKKQADSQIGGLLDEIAAKEQNIQSLSELLETEKVKDALRGLRKDIAGGAWKGLESGVQGIDGMVNAFSQLREVMSDQDASGWEKFMAGFNALSQTVNTIIAVVQTIEMLMTAIKTLQALKEAQQAKENALATTEIARNTATAASEGGKSAMKKLPFPLNVLAIAGVIATVIGAFAALPKFAKGGIVGEGPRQGDKVLARLNRGEGVLTEQGLNGLGDLAGAARTAPIDVRISGKLKASGRDLELVIDQQQRFRKRTR